MTSLCDHTNKTVAYLHHFAILEPGTYKLVGLILGNCIFNIHGQLKGKLIGHKILDADGAIIAQEGPKASNGTLDNRNLLEQAWSILTRIRQHTLNWVQPSGQWSHNTLYDYLIN